MKPEFPIWTSGSRIVCFSCSGHNEFVARAGRMEINRLSMARFARVTSPAGFRLINGVLVNWESGKSHMTRSGLTRTWPPRPRAVTTADLLRRTICSQHRQSSTDYSGSTLVLSVRCQALIAQCDQPGRDICSQRDYCADARDVKHFAHTGSYPHEYETPT
jgi:hypothetical protein